MFNEFFIVSVGNLSVGGTGKTVFIQYLADTFFKKNSFLIVSRGYGRKVKKREKNFFITPLNKHLWDVSIVGDEPWMLLSNLDCFIAVGSNKKKIFKTLCGFNLSLEKKITNVLLDDAYQNFSIKKNFEILLIDARKDVFSSYCLPLGQFREKDYARADVIVLTHFKKDRASNLLHHLNVAGFDQNKIFRGSHVFTGLFYHNNGVDSTKSLKNKKVIIFSGIADDLSFFNMVNECGLDVIFVKKFIDHHDYSINDIEFLLKQSKKLDCFSFITTQKDWFKVLKVFNDYKMDISFFCCYVLSVKFNFFSMDDDLRFKELFKKKISLYEESG